jgi:hypothetical protein
MTYSSFFTSNPELEIDVVTISDNVVHNDSFPNPTFTFSTPFPPPFFQPNNNMFKSNIPKQDPANVKRLPFNVITSLQKNVRSLESEINVLHNMSLKNSTINTLKSMKF